ncbi:MAG TPA: YggS family pyridoxal phosphate-dependent enzyme [Candidatus Binatia bacterium]|nr:YggS family pyridoxal phosphate-dependent enzyme [Candidatus Binatia bacterium]
MSTDAATRIPERLLAVRGEIAKCAHSAGRKADDITLVAVTKRVPLEGVRAAVAAGQKDFGENYVQEGIGKIDALAAPDLRWHLIGALQSNKAARAARSFHLLHSVCGESVARAISREMVALGREARVLLQIRLGGGAGRAGVEPEQAEAMARALTALPGIVLDGVMGVAAPGEAARPQFARLFALLERLRGCALPRAPLREMSAGMSADFADAICEGATMVRIGSAIFGDRD